jgi:hypothetical protein
MAQEVILNVRANTKEAENSLKSVNSEIKNTQQVSGELTGSLDKMTGGAITKFTAFKGTLKGVTGGFKSLRVAILSTGIGALILAVTALTAAFTGSEEGQNKFAKIMGVIGALTGNLVDLLADLGEGIISVFENPKQALLDFKDLLVQNITNRFNSILETVGYVGKAIKLVFEGEFSKALDVGKKAASSLVDSFTGIPNTIDRATEATKGFIKEQIEEGKAAASVADMRAKADKIERQLIVDRSKLESEIALLRLKSRQEDEFTAKERKQALLDAQALEEQLLAQETEYLELRRDAQVLENTFSRSNKENLDKEAQAIAEVNRVVARRADAARSTQRELNRVSKEIERDEQAKAKEEQAKIDADIKKEQDRLAAIQKIQDDFRTKQEDRDVQSALEKVQLEESRKLAELDRLNATEEEKQSIRDYYAKEKLVAEAADTQASIELSNKEADAKRQNLAAVGNALSSFASLVGEQTGVGKAAAIAATLISTYQSAQDSYKSLAGIPIVGPVLGAAAAAAAVASGFKQIQAIKATKVPNDRGKSNVATPGASSVTAAAQAPSFNVVGGGATNQLAGLLAEETQKPVKAYVVSNEVTTAQSLDRNIVESATLG